MEANVARRGEKHYLSSPIWRTDISPLHNTGCQRETSLRSELHSAFSAKQWMSDWNISLVHTWNFHTFCTFLLASSPGKLNSHIFPKFMVQPDTGWSIFDDAIILHYKDLSKFSILDQKSHSKTSNVLPIILKFYDPFPMTLLFMWQCLQIYPGINDREVQLRLWIAV